jgi:phosphatidylserine decarboxylase
MNTWIIVIAICGIVGLLILGLIFFYRFPDYNGHIKELGLNNKNLYSPAHGVVSDIRYDNEHDETLVSIFLNVYDIHHQYSPCSGTVQKLEYNEGNFSPAGFFEKTRDNERMKITISHMRDDGEMDMITITQIAGLIARVIQTDVKENDDVFQGGYLGMIKLGSRVDITFPTSKYEIVVKEGQRVNGLNDIIATHV